MGFSETTWVPGDLQAHAVELWAAAKERNTALPAYLQESFTVPSAGANIQIASTGTYSFKFLQNWIAAKAQYFVRSHNDNGTARAANYYHGAADIEMWTFANLLKSAAAGIALSDFVAATDWPTDWTDFEDAAYSEARQAAGDIIGPWIPYLLQQCFKRLLWTKGVSTSASTAGKSYYASSEGSFAVWADAKTAAENNWPAGSDYYNLQYAQSYGTASGDDYYSTQLYRAYSYDAYIFDDTISKTVDFYAKATAPDGGDFDDNGDGVLEDVWAIWLSDAVAADAGTTVESSSPLGDSGFPTWCPQPATSTTEILGYAVVSGGLDAVARWDFEYV